VELVISYNKISIKPLKEGIFSAACWFVINWKYYKWSR